MRGALRAASSPVEGDPVTDSETSYTRVRERLAEWRSEVIEQLRGAGGDGALLTLKLEIEAALRCLDLCERAGITGTERVHTLPSLEGRGGYSEYRVLDDAETEDREHWTEPEIEGEKRRLTPGDVLIERVPRRRR
ncbi:MAG: hypothetical protein ACAI25_16505 [Planctomycetota bacterium]